MLLRMKLLEPGCILVLAALGSSTLNQQKVISADGHGFVMQSFLRVQLRRGSAVVDTSGSPGCQRSNNFLVKDLISAAIKFFVK